MTRRTWWAFLGVCGLAALAWIGWTYLAPGTPEEVGEIQGPTPIYFRFQADYSHKGEPIRFDYVVVCRIHVPLDKAGEIMSDGSYAPMVFIKATSHGGALMVRTPNACFEDHTTESGEVPEDLLPFVIWFDDVEDLSYGLGYASEDAYESPRAEVAFHGARISAATREDWEQWRAEAEESFQPQGMIPGPWGYSYTAWGYSDPALGHSYREPYMRWDGEPYDPNKKRIARQCDGYFRLKLPPDVSERIRAEWPDARPRFWAPPADQTSRILNMITTRRMPGTDSYETVLFDGGHPFRRFPRGSSIEIGVPTRAGGGTVFSPGDHRPSDNFPLLPRSQSMPELSKVPLESYPRRVALSEDMKGFLACGGEEHVDGALSSFDPNYRRKRHPIFVNDELLLEDYNPHSKPHLLFDRDQYVLVGTPWGVAGP